MSDSRTSILKALGELASILVLVGVNLLFIMVLGNWLVYTGLFCIALLGVSYLLILVQRSRWGRICLDLVFVLTLFNFNGWAFSHLSNLLVYVGLFFFALFGLILGATLFRLLAHFRPLPKVVFVSIGMLFVLGAWWGGLALEASYYPGDFYLSCIEKFRRPPPEMTPEEQKEKILEQACDFLEENYGSCDTISYLRWGLASGEAKLPVPGRAKLFLYKRPQRQTTLWIRLGLSLGLLSFGVLSSLRMLDLTEEQVLKLRAQSAEETDQE